MVIILLIIIVGIIGFGIWWWVTESSRITNLERQLAEPASKTTVASTPTGIVITSPTPTASTTPIPTSTPDKYAGWNTYVNDYYGYEIRYPENWEVSSPKADVIDLKTVEFIDPPHDGISVVFAGPKNFDFHLITQKTNESFSIAPTGIGWTGTEAGNKMSFSGTEVQKLYELFYGQGQQHSSFHYVKPGRGDHLLFTVGDREYILSCMHKSGTQYLEAKLDSETDAIIDKMVESFRIR